MPEVVDMALVVGGGAVTLEAATQLFPLLNVAEEFIHLVSEAAMEALREFAPILVEAIRDGVRVIIIQLSVAVRQVAYLVSTLIPFVGFVSGMIADALVATGSAIAWFFTGLAGFLGISPLALGIIVAAAGAIVIGGVLYYRHRPQGQP